MFDIVVVLSSFHDVLNTQCSAFIQQSVAFKKSVKTKIQKDPNQMLDMSESRLVFVCQ